MILVYCEQQNMQVGLPPALVNGQHVHHRTYTADGHWLVVDADDAYLVAHDAETILAFPGFRLATAEEQNAFAADGRKVGKISEGKAGKSSDKTAVNGG